MTHKDDLNINFLICESENNKKLSETLSNMTLMILEESDLSNKGIQEIIKTGGMCAGGLKHLESRCFNHSLGYYIENPEYKQYHLRELKNCLKLLENKYPKNSMKLIKDVI